MDWNQQLDTRKAGIHPSLEKQSAGEKLPPLKRASGEGIKSPREARLEETFRQELKVVTVNEF